MSKVSTAPNAALLAPKAKTILFALRSSSLSPQQIVEEAQKSGVKLSSSCVTAYAGSPTKHTVWDEVAREGSSSWKTVSLLGHKLVVAKKETVNTPKGAKSLYVYSLTASGKKALKTLS